MIFETCNGKCFNSISLEHLKLRFGLSHSSYSICIQYDNKLYVHASYDTLEACRRKACKFVKQFQTDFQIYYFERPTADDWCQELIEEVHAPHSRMLSECQKAEQKVRNSDHDSSIEINTQKYLDFLKNSY